MISSGRARPSLYEFAYESPTRAWSAPLLAIPCMRCGKLAARTLPYCPRCLASEAHCKLARTELRDADDQRYDFLGLFAHDPAQPRGAVVFRQDDVVLPYLGEVRDSVEWLTERYGGYTVPYGFKHSNAVRYTDSALIRGAGASINTANSEHDNNLVFRDAQPLASIVACKRIRNGDELLLDYGELYRLDEPAVQFDTSLPPAHVARRARVHSGAASDYRRQDSGAGGHWRHRSRPLPQLRR